MKSIGTSLHRYWGKGINKLHKIKPGSRNSRTVFLYGPQLNSNTLTVAWFFNSPHFLPETSKSMAPYSSGPVSVQILFIRIHCAIRIFSFVYLSYLPLLSRKQLISPFDSRAKDYWANDHVQGSGQCFRLVAGACRRWWCWECGARHRFQGVGSGIFAHVNFIRRK